MSILHYRMTHAEHEQARGGYVDPDRYRKGHRDYRPEMLCRTGDAHARSTREVAKVTCPYCLPMLLHRSPEGA